MVALPSSERAPGVHVQHVRRISCAAFRIHTQAFGVMGLGLLMYIWCWVMRYIQRPLQAAVWMSWMRQRSAAILHMLTIFAISFISKLIYVYIECRFILHGICISKVYLRLTSAVNIVYLLKNHAGGHSIDTRAYTSTGRSSVLRHYPRRRTRRRPAGRRLQTRSPTTPISNIAGSLGRPC